MVDKLSSDPDTLYYVTPTTTNVCTAAVWHEELIGGLDGETETTGPYFTTCDLYSSGEQAESASMICMLLHIL